MDFAFVINFADHFLSGCHSILLVSLTQLRKMHHIRAFTRLSFVMQNELLITLLFLFLLYFFTVLDES